MKVFVLALAYVALCASSAIPQIPGDNSYYVKGERYFFMSDGEGVPHLVDSQAPRDLEYLATKDGSSNKYWLYTRDNPTTAQVLEYGNINSVLSSNYVATRPLIVIAHGWVSNGNNDGNLAIIEATLLTSDANVLILDWSTIAFHWNYFLVVEQTPDVGRHLGNFLVWLINNAGGNWNNVHLVGHSLGAHVVGNAGRQAGGLSARITVLDAALPGWEDNDEMLTTTDGIYVEAIHTDGNGSGFFNPIADADFYPNGGKDSQPGCLQSSCSHGRSVDLFASSVRTNHFVGKRCDSLEQVSIGNCNGPSLNMGNNVLTKRGSGIYYLVTGSSWPY